ncbi:MAG: hypothetical protein HUU38_23185 [Anaerolineales bacterium]|nr:hypothetical protein [Anaerolineales bacterium]
MSLLVVYQFALPRPNWINFGSISNYPPQNTPYFVRQKTPVFIVNTGEKFLVLAPQAPHPKACQLSWRAEDAIFIEPCLGIQFYLDGTYLQGPSNRGMDQYEFKVEAGTLWVNVEHKILGEIHP